MSGVAREGDFVKNHNCSGTPHENIFITQSSENTNLNNKGIAREGDLVLCEDTLGVGSKNVFVNGKSMARLDDPTTFHLGTCDFAKIITASENVLVN